MSHVPDTGHRHIFIKYMVRRGNLSVGQGMTQVIFPLACDSSITEAGTQFSGN